MNGIAVREGQVTEAAALEIQGLTKSYGAFRLGPLDLELRRGSILGLIGENGAGKSTLIKSVMGLIARESGAIRLPGAARHLDARETGLRIGYVPESLVFYDWMTVARFLRFTSKFYPSWDEQVCGSLLRQFELDPAKTIKDLSKGMRAKLALIMSLSHRPSILLLDEPTSGLDPVMKHRFLSELSRAVEAGLTQSVVISSHILGEVEQIADRIVVLRQGAKIFDDRKSALLNNWKKIRFAGPLPADDAPLPPYKIHPMENGYRALVVPEQKLQEAVNAIRRLGGTEINVINPSLHEVFIQLT